MSNFCEHLILHVPSRFAGPSTLRDATPDTKARKLFTKDVFGPLRQLIDTIKKKKMSQHPRGETNRRCTMGEKWHFKDTEESEFLILWTSPHPRKFAIGF